MSKFTKEQRDEIITLKLQGTKAKEIMQNLMLVGLTSIKC